MYRNRAPATYRSSRQQTAAMSMLFLGDIPEQKMPMPADQAWEYVVPFFAFAPGVRKMIYTTNAVEALHRSLRKIIKTRGSFPNDDAALKLLYLAIKNAGLRWRRGIEWTAAMGQFAIQFGERFPGTAR
jgi:putative transposase